MVCISISYLCSLEMGSYDSFGLGNQCKEIFSSLRGTKGSNVGVIADVYFFEVRPPGLLLPDPTSWVNTLNDLSL